MSKIVMYGGTAHEVDERGRIIGQASLGDDVIANMLVGAPIAYRLMVKLTIGLSRWLMKCRDFIVTTEEREFWEKKESKKLQFAEGSGFFTTQKNIMIASRWGNRALLGCICTPFYRVYRLIKKPMKKDVTTSPDTEACPEGMKPVKRTTSIMSVVYIGFEAILMGGLTILLMNFIPALREQILGDGSGIFVISIIVWLVITLLMCAQNNKLDESRK